MSYYEVLGLNKEPFSTSPEPDFFYQSSEHKSALYRVRISLELKRGMSLILGEVGVGKTTLMRKLFRLLTEEDGFITKVILDPSTKSEHSFLSILADAFQIKPGFKSIQNFKKAIKNYLFEKSITENKTVVLFVDEAQTLSEVSMEVLRTLLNFETNQNKLIQIVLLGQMELLPVISKINNLWDRIALKYVINPLEESEVKEMIEFRLRNSGYIERMPLFSDSAINAIYNYTQGYPRKITMICHNAIQEIVMNNKTMVDKDVVQNLIQMDSKLTCKV